MEIQDAITRLEEWKYANKGRWVEISIDDGYGATCWSVLLGNRNVSRKEGWAFQNNKDATGCVVSAAECSFFDYDSIPPNIVFVNTEEETFPGLAKVILAALDRAKELGV